MRVVAACVAMVLLALAMPALAPSRALAQPVPAQIPTDFVAVGAGERFSCALAADGRAFCWGADWYGQLGAGGVAGRCDESIYARGACSRTPVEVAGGLRFAKLHVADDHACAIESSGEAWCWGEGNSGQLARETGALEQCTREPSRKREDGITLACSRRPVRIPLPAAAVAIDGGESMTCAVDANGDAWCWAWRGGPPRHIPLDRKLETIAAGGHMACGITDQDGIRCWDMMELDRHGVQTPTPVKGFASLDVGTAHACALTFGGLAYCWGRDRDAALGTGATTHDSFEEVPFTPVAGGRRYGRIVTGPTTTCATDAGNGLWCWGRVPESSARANDRCLDSNGMWRSNDCTNRPVRVHADEKFVNVAIGATHRCGVTFTGRLVCWGENEAGQLGDGTVRASHEPVRVRFEPLTAAEAKIADARASVGTLLARGGLALLVVLALVVAAGDRVARWGGPEFGALALAALVVYTIAIVAGPRALNMPADELRETVRTQLVVLVAGLGAWRLALVARAWWQGGREAAAATASSAPDVRPRRAAGAALPGDGDRRGMLALGTVLSGWAVFAWAILSTRATMAGPNRPHGEVGAGLVMFGLLVMALVSLALAIAGGTMATFRLRTHRRDTAARAALALGALTVVVAVVAYAWMVWPREY